MLYQPIPQMPWMGTETLLWMMGLVYIQLVTFSLTIKYICCITARQVIWFSVIIMAYILQYSNRQYGITWRFEILQDVCHYHYREPNITNDSILKKGLHLISGLSIIYDYDYTNEYLCLFEVMINDGIPSYAGPLHSFLPRYKMCRIRKQSK